MGSAELLVELARGRSDAGPVEAGVGVRARLPVCERLDRREREMARVERDAVAAQHRLRVLIGGAPCVAVVGIDGLVPGQPDQRPPAEVLERSGPAWEAALQLARGVGAPRLDDQPVTLAVEASAPARQAQRSARAGGGGGRRGAGGMGGIRHRGSFRGCARTPAHRGRSCGWVDVRAGGARRFSGRARARSGGCARRRSARRGRASARARAGSDRRSRRSGRRRPRRSRCGCPQRAARMGQQQAGAWRASVRLGSLGVIE